LHVATVGQGTLTLVTPLRALRALRTLRALRALRTLRAVRALLTLLNYSVQDDLDTTDASRVCVLAGWKRGRKLRAIGLARVARICYDGRD